MHPPVRLIMADRGPRISVWSQTGPGNPLEVVQYGINLVFRRGIVQMPCDHPGSVSVLEIQTVRNLANHARIPTKHRDADPLDAGRILFILQVFSSPGTAAGAMRQKLDHHW